MRAAALRAGPGLVLAATLALATGCDPGGEAGGGSGEVVAPLSPPELLSARVEPRGRIDPGYAAEATARVAALDLDRDGRDELAVASARELAILGIGEGRSEVLWRAPSRGGATAVASGDLDGDGHRDLVVGWGAHREARDAPARLVAYLTRGQPPGHLRVVTLAAPATSRAQFTSLAVARLDADRSPGVLATHFVSKYEARGAFFPAPSAEGPRERELFRIRMASELVAGRLRPSDPETTLVVGRPYGDAVKSDGDVFALDRGGRVRLPSLRGIRSLSLLPGLAPGGDRPLVCYGDGWHWRYRERGEARISCAWRRDDGRFEGGPVARLPGYAVEELLWLPTRAGDPARPGVLLALGVEGLFVLLPPVAPGAAWESRRLGSAGFGMAVLDLGRDHPPHVALGGESPRLVPLAAAGL